MVAAKLTEWSRKREYQSKELMMFVSRRRMLKMKVSRRMMLMMFILRRMMLRMKVGAVQMIIQICAVCKAGSWNC